MTVRIGYFYMGKYLYLVFALRMANSPTLSALVHYLAKLDTFVADSASGSLVLRLLDKLMLPVHPSVAVAPHHRVPRSDSHLHHNRIKADIINNSFSSPVWLC